MKKPVENYMPQTWAAALEMLHKNGDFGFGLRSREEIRADSGCGSDVLTALHRMGALRQFERDGKMYPFLLENPTSPLTAAAIREKIQEMNQRRDKEFGKVIQAAQEAGTFPSPPSSAEEINTDTALAEAIKLIIRAGGMVVFGETKK